MDNGELRIQEEGRVEGGLNVCKTCHEYLSKNKLPPAAMCNGMDFGPIHDDLRGLNVMEQAMISIYAPMVRLISLTQGGVAHRGNCINLQNPVLEQVRLLPRRPNETDIVYVRTTGYEGPTQHFPVRSMLVRRALLQLCKFHRAYKDVVVNEALLQELEADATLHQAPGIYHTYIASISYSQIYLLIFLLLLF